MSNDKLGIIQEGHFSVLSDYQNISMGFSMGFKVTKLETAYNQLTIINDYNTQSSSSSSLS